MEPIHGLKPAHGPIASTAAKAQHGQPCISLFVAILGGSRLDDLDKRVPTPFFSSLELPRPSRYHVNVSQLPPHRSRPRPLPARLAIPAPHPGAELLRIETDTSARLRSHESTRPRLWVRRKVPRCSCGVWPSPTEGGRCYRCRIEEPAPLYVPVLRRLSADIPVNNPVLSRPSSRAPDCPASGPSFTLEHAFLRATRKTMALTPATRQTSAPQMAI